MTWRNKLSCSFTPVTKCTIIGFYSIVISLLLIMASIVYLCEQEQKKIEFLQKTLHGSTNKIWIDFVIVMTLTLSSLWMIFSGTLIIGVVKNYVGFVLCYFVYGIFIVIAFNLGALLLLLHMHWIIAVTEIIMSLFYVRMLVIIYDVYDLMQRGKVINTNEQSLLDEEPI